MQYREHSVLQVTKRNQLMLFSVVVTVYCESYRKRIYPVKKM